MLSHYAHNLQLTNGHRSKIVKKIQRILFTISELDDGAQFVFHAADNDQFWKTVKKDQLVSHLFQQFWLFLEHWIKTKTRKKSINLHEKVKIKRKTQSNVQVRFSISLKNFKFYVRNNSLSPFFGIWKHEAFQARSSSQSHFMSNIHCYFLDST